MTLSGGWTELNAALKTLRAHWETVQADWDDKVQREFEEKTWQLLEHQVQSVLRAMDRLSPHLAKARDECS